MVLQRIFRIAFCVVLLSACTKEAPYEQENKEKFRGKSLVSTTDEYLYSVSLQEASRTSEDARPFVSGDNKRVKLEWNESSLRIIETERDARFQDNRTNNKLVLEIPVDHVEYKCKTDKYGECTNTEEEDTKKNWYEKNGFKIKLTEAKSGELDLLPIMVSQTIGEDCYQEISSKLLSAQITDDSLNFQIERNYRTKIECLGMTASISDAPVTGVFHYSLAKVKSVLSPKFKTVAYPDTDESAFGFFSTEKVTLGVDNNRTESGKTLIMNHWNPHRKVIDYYLSEAFNKPENAKIKSLTKKTIDSLNDGLAQADVKFRIKLHDPVPGKVPGDIRNSMIVLVEDPVASSVIGYGPQTEDPVTGEIISARTIMFLGTIKKFIKSTYEEILRAKKTEAFAKNSQGQIQKTSPLALSNELKAKLTTVKTSAAKDLAPLLIPSPLHEKPALSVNPAQISKEILKASKTLNVNQEFITMDRKAQLKYMLDAKNCALEMTERSVSSGISETLLAKVDLNSKPWEQLSEKEQQAMIDLILPEVWVPTLIHEMGHNLGLRHNFSASEDKDHFLSDSELKALNIDHPIPFSSVMDYGNDLKALPVLGKYDIAALRFAYPRKVETEDGKLIPLSESLEQMTSSPNSPQLKNFNYCTDEHVGVNAGCKRFDEGTSLTEITAHLIQEYQSAYYLRNFRRGKENFSLYEDPTYASRIRSIFTDIRSMFETYEGVKNRFRIPDNSPQWETLPYLSELKKATIMGGEFFIDVLLTPGLRCVIVKSDDPKTIVDIVTFADLLPPGQAPIDAFSTCEEIALSDEYKIVGSIGKYINSLKDPQSKNHYTDQIDFRGTWIDKVLAAEHLFKRQTGNSSFDKYADNYMDVNDMNFRQKLANAVLAFQNGHVESLTPDKDTVTVKMTLFDGSQQNLELQSYDLLNDHLIKKPISKWTAYLLNVPDKERYLQEKIGKIVAKEMVNGVGRESYGAPLSSALMVNRFQKHFIPMNHQNIKDLLNIDLGQETFYASEDNFVASNAIQGIRDGTILRNIKAEELTKIIEAREKGETSIPTSASANEIAAWKMPLETLKTFQAGDLPSPRRLEIILRNLPSNLEEEK